MRFFPLLSFILILAAVSGCSPAGGELVAENIPVVQPPAPSPAQIRAELIAEINLVRTNPRGYADLLAGQLPSYRGTEGTVAIEECIHELRNTVPMEPLSSSASLDSAAADHVLDQGGRGLLGHGGTDGSQPFDRILRYLDTDGGAENLAYGLHSPRDIVMALMIDDGVPSRGHRKNILNPSYRLAGIAIGDHSTYGTMCVMDFAFPVSERSATAPNRKRIVVE